MKKSLITLASVLALTTTAIAQEQAAIPNIGLAIATDNEYNMDTEVFKTEVGVEASVQNLILSLSPTYDWDKSEVDNVELAVQYNVGVTDKFTLAPYAELNLDNDLEEKDKIVGFKTRFVFN